MAALKPLSGSEKKMPSVFLNFEGRNQAFGRTNAPEWEGGRLFKILLGL